MKTVFISGCTGQLGAYLSKLYLYKGYKVIGGFRRSANWNPWRLKWIKTFDKIEFEVFDLADQSSIDEAVKKHKPDLFINAGAQSFVGSSWTTGEYTIDVTGIGVYRCLEAIRKHSPETRFLQMSSSEMFGDNPDYPYNEKSLFMPRSPYGCAKCLGYHLVTNFRQSYGLFAANLISFNFESPLRGDEFVTKKIVREAYRVHTEHQVGKIITPMSLGNLNPTRDWIYAGDTAHAVELILDHEKPDDFCIASGVTTSVRDFCTLTFRLLGHEIEWLKDEFTGLVETDVLELGVTKENTPFTLVQSLRTLYRPADVPHLIGDATKAREVLGWKPTKDLENIIKEMLEFEYANQS